MVFNFKLKYFHINKRWSTYDFFSEIQTTMKRTWLTMTTTVINTTTIFQKTTTKITTILKLLKMQQFMFLIILIAIINLNLITAKSVSLIYKQQLSISLPFIILPLLAR